jgi:hypothetical protein
MIFWSNFSFSLALFVAVRGLSKKVSSGGDEIYDTQSQDARPESVS